MLKEVEQIICWLQTLTFLLPPHGSGEQSLILLESAPGKKYAIFLPIFSAFQIGMSFKYLYASSWENRDFSILVYVLHENPA